jgi:hypothetical protein
MGRKKTLPRREHTEDLTTNVLIEVREIGRRNRRLERLVAAGRRPSVQCSHLRGHFFTAK